MRNTSQRWHLRGCPGLKEERRPLRTWINYEWAFEFVIFALVLDSPDLGRIDIRLRTFVLDNSPIGNG